MPIVVIELTQNFLINSYLADSGTINGVASARRSGAEVAIANVFQSAIHRAIHGKRLVAIVKKIAMDIFATKVLHLAPVYSRTNELNY